MVKKDQILSLEYYRYKGMFSGSFKGMRYRIEKITKGEEDFFEVYVWPEPYNFEMTSKEVMKEKNFPFTDEGRESVVNWINENYKKGVYEK